MKSNPRIAALSLALLLAAPSAAFAQKAQKKEGAQQKPPQIHGSNGQRAAQRR